MKVNLIKWSNVINLCSTNSQMDKAFQIFREKVRYADWNSPQDALNTFNHTDIVVCEDQNWNRMVFNIGGNKYRLVCGYHVGANKMTLFVKFAGTHKEYDDIDVCTVNKFS